MNAIVSLVIGNYYQSNWRKFCKHNWEEYAKKYNFDLIILDKPLDSGKRSQSRSPAWQKCLVPEAKEVASFDRIVWIDSDIIINYLNAPNIFHECPVEKIGGTDHFYFYSRSNYDHLLDNKYRYWNRNKALEFTKFEPYDYYQSWGLNTKLKDILQTGVMVISPIHHAAIFRYVYYNYEDKGGDGWNFEMRPLSFEIVKNEKHQFINERYNILFNNFKFNFYPDVVKLKDRYSLFHRVANRFGMSKYENLVKRAAQTAFANSYFLHFAGCRDEMRFVNTSKGSLVDLMM